MTAKRRRKKPVPGKTRFRLSLLLVILIILGVLSPLILWLARPALQVRVLVLDKTVPTPEAKQHRSLGWILHHYKMQDESGELHASETEYRGYHPERDEAERVTTLDMLPADVDLIYIADTYGVYMRENDITTILAEGERNLIHGGLSQSDIDVLRSFLNREGPNTVIAEYNTFATPTSDHIQTQAYEMFRAQWTGWAGLYVRELSRSGDAPSWVYAMYEHKSGKPWAYSGSGIILYHTSEEIVVLTMEEDLGPGANRFFFTEAGTEQLGLEGSHYYPHMFDIVTPLSGAEVLARYDLDVTASGSEKLHRSGIPASFPAIIRGSVAYHHTYYFAGNWAYSPLPMKFSFLAGVPDLMKRASPDSLESEQHFHWHAYLPIVRAIADEVRAKKQSPHARSTPSHTVVDGTSMVARTHLNMLQIWQEDEWKDLFIHGVNLGIAMPGRWFTDFPKDKATYYRWLEKIGTMGANTVRIYTLLDPEFYDAFLLYNTMHPDRLLWLMQEIWPEEEPHGNDYLAADYQQQYEREIEHVIDAIHGNASIAERRGRAWGTYTSDVSPYVIGYLVGRELEPHEVEATDLLNEGYGFSGEYLIACSEASPTEAWLAASTDYVVAYEESAYGWQHPVAIVNWPTLDPIDHPSERNEQGLKISESNDRITVDINNLLPGPRLKSGLFGAYHIYPNYPDFMNNDPLYDTYSDEQGRFRYGGYLQQFMSHHRAYPAVVAEFGLATGMGNAHTSGDGYHHGSMTEVVQGEGIIRMFEAMHREGYAGGIIFEWMDEWAKKTWTTEPYMIPYDRHILWHNAIDPEQNYGLLAYEAVKPARAAVVAQGEHAIRSVELRIDASFLHLDITLETPVDFTKERLLIGLDTVSRDQGELLYDARLGVQAPSGMEYLIVLDGTESSRLLAIPPSDGTNYAFSTYDTLVSTGDFRVMRKLTNKARALADGTPIPAIHEESSRLLHGAQTGSTNHWEVNGKSLTVRIPWTRINVSDPSSGTVLYDKEIRHTDPARDVIGTIQTDGIAVSGILVQHKTDRILGQFGTREALLLPWTTWNQPTYREREKASYDILRDYLEGQRER